MRRVVLIILIFCIGCAALVPLGVQVGTDLAEEYLYQKYLQDKKLNDPALMNPANQERK